MRKIIQFHPLRQGDVLALADDGTLWELGTRLENGPTTQSLVREWSQIAALPPRPKPARTPEPKGVGFYTGQAREDIAAWDLVTIDSRTGYVSRARSENG